MTYALPPSAALGTGRGQFGEQVHHFGDVAVRGRIADSERGHQAGEGFALVQVHQLPAAPDGPVTTDATGNRPGADAGG